MSTRSRIQEWPGRLPLSETTSKLIWVEAPSNLVCGEYWVRSMLSIMHHPSSRLPSLGRLIRIFLFSGDGGAQAQQDSLVTATAMPVTSAFGVTE